MLPEELRCLDIADGMADRGDPLTMEQLDKILRDPRERQRFLTDPLVDVDTRDRLRTLVRNAETTVEACNELWQMKWYVMQCRFNPALATRSKRFWSFMAPHSLERPAFSETDGSA